MSSNSNPVFRCGPKPSDGAGDATQSGVLFVGTGVSTAIPVIGHDDGKCACADAIANPTGPNHRGNVSLLIRDATSNVLIDVGKTFRESYFRTLMPRRITKIDAIFLTHDHADAIFGVDDLRDLQRFRVEGHKYICETPLPVYLSDRTLQTLNKGLDYVISNSVVVGPADVPVVDVPKEVVVERRVACLRLRVVDDQKVTQLRLEPGVLDGIPVYSLPVFHGGTYRCLGFAFGRGCSIATPVADRSSLEPEAGAGACVVYLSDVSGLPEDVEAALLGMTAIDVLVVDMLMLEKSHFSHYCVDDAWKLIMKLQPRVAYGVGMYCDIEHGSVSEMFATRLAQAKKDLAPGATCRVEFVGLAYDGLDLPLPL